MRVHPVRFRSVSFRNVAKTCQSQWPPSSDNHVEAVVFICSAIIMLGDVKSVAGGRRPLLVAGSY